VLGAGLTWIGPPPDAVRALGDKVAAREVGRRVGAPMVVGTDRTVTEAAEVEASAAAHGLPIAIKAAAGGGGRGIKIVHRAEDIAELFASAVREAELAFGRGECFVERYLSRARHVEAQVLADRYGTVVVVGTRDCSLQRRHQKLVEEGPAPFLTAGQRRSIHQSAAAICRAAGYESAGTVEYLVGEDGTVTRFDVPTGPGIRLDSGVEAGSVIGGQFDSLLAKLIVTGRDRDHALARARRALAELRIDGVTTVVPFHRRVVDHPDFVGDGAGFAVHTRWIDEEFLPAADAAGTGADDGLPASVTIRIAGRAHPDGVVRDLAVKPGDTVAQDAPICHVVEGAQAPS